VVTLKLLTDEEDDVVEAGAARRDGGGSRALCRHRLSTTKREKVRPGHCMTSS
jgi:hypothetical protein